MSTALFDNSYVDVQITSARNLDRIPMGSRLYVCVSIDDKVSVTTLRPVESPMWLEHFRIRCFEGSNLLFRLHATPLLAPSRSDQLVGMANFKVDSLIFQPDGLECWVPLLVQSPTSNGWGPAPGGVVIRALMRGVGPMFRRPGTYTVRLPPDVHRSPSPSYVPQSRTTRPASAPPVRSTAPYAQPISYAAYGALQPEAARDIDWWESYTRRVIVSNESYERDTLRRSAAHHARALLWLLYDPAGEYSGRGLPPMMPASPLGASAGMSWSDRPRASSAPRGGYAGTSTPMTYAEWRARWAASMASADATVARALGAGLESNPASRPNSRGSSPSRSTATAQYAVMEAERSAAMARVAAAEARERSRSPQRSHSQGAITSSSTPSASHGPAMAPSTIYFAHNIPADYASILRPPERVWYGDTSAHTPSPYRSSDAIAAEIARSEAELASLSAARSAALAAEAAAVSAAAASRARSHSPLDSDPLADMRPQPITRGTPANAAYDPPHSASPSYTPRGGDAWGSHREGPGGASPSGALSGSGTSPSETRRPQRVATSSAIVTPAMLSTAPVQAWMGPVFVTDAEISVARHVLNEVTLLLPRIAPGAYRVDVSSWLRPVAGYGAVSPAAAGVYVNLANTHLSDSQLAHVLQLLLPLRCVRSVDVSGNILTDEGASAIGSLMRSAGGGDAATAGTLMRVDVSSNRISMSGMIMLADAVRRAPSVIQLFAYNQGMFGALPEELRELGAVTHAVQNSLSARAAAARLYSAELLL